MRKQLLKMRTYLDHNAASPLKPQARQAMIEEPFFANASSLHQEGRRSFMLLEEARMALAYFVGVLPFMITFTSSGTEANNLALKGAPLSRLLVSAIEHPSVLRAAEQSGKALEIIPVTSDGIIDLEALERLLEGPKALISVMLANNETGLIQPIAQIAEMVRKTDGLLHCDASQALGKIPVNFQALGVDLLTLSAHKIGGPQAIGALIVRDGIDLSAQVHGGGQERSLRAGTQNIAGAVGFAAALELLPSSIEHLRDRLESGLEEAYIIGRGQRRLPNTTFFASPGRQADMMLLCFDLEGISVSSGSACSSGKVEASHVLQAMGADPELTKSAIRVSLGWNSTQADIDHFLQAWARLRTDYNLKG